MADLDTLTLPVLPLTNDVVLPHMVVTLALETDEARPPRMPPPGPTTPCCSSPARPTAATPASAPSPASRTGATCPAACPPWSSGPRPAPRSASASSARPAALWVHVSPLPDGEVTGEVDELATELRAALRALFESLGGRRLTEVLRGVDDPSALADIVGWWPDLAVERKVELLETTRARRAPAPGAGLGQGGAGRARAGRQDPSRRVRGPGGPPARVPAAPADGRHPQGAGRGRWRRPRRRLPRAPDQAGRGQGGHRRHPQGHRARDRAAGAHARAEHRARLDPQLAGHRVRDSLGRAQRRRLRHRACPPGPRRGPHRPRRGEGPHRRDAGRAQAAGRARRRVGR